VPTVTVNKVAIPKDGPAPRMAYEHKIALTTESLFDIDSNVLTKNRF
jgi:hypothetical protein